MRIFPELEVLLQKSKKPFLLFKFYTFSANFSSVALIVALESWCVKNNNNNNNKKNNNSKGLIVECGLTSHSVIFQLYSDGRDVQFPNFDLLPVTHVMGS